LRAPTRNPITTKKTLIRIRPTHSQPHHYARDNKAPSLQTQLNLCTLGITNYVRNKDLDATQ